jgi:3-methylcrotonyl-CoA carboxylase alpha subunit
VDGFRLGAVARPKIEVVVDGRRLSVEAPEIARPETAMRLASGAIAVMRAGETFLVRQYDPFEAADAAGMASDRVTAPMPGKIAQLLVRPGDRVKKGQPLAVLEAMKMEHTLAAPADALVATVDAAAGDQVGEGAIIVRFAREKSAVA